MTDAPPPYPGINGYSGYATGTAGAGGFTAPPGGGHQGMSAADAKAAEAAQVQTGYVDPNNPQTAYIPPVFSLSILAEYYAQRFHKTIPQKKVSK
jgi:hypothetical protein